MTSPASVTYGPIFVGVVLNIALYGIMATQTFLYFTVYKRDKTWTKVFVALLFICDSLNCGFDCAFLYIPLISKYGNTSALNVASWVFATDPAMTAVIALLVQMFFAWRVKVLTKNWFVVGFIGLCSLCQWCGGMGTAIAVGMVPEFTEFQRFEAIVIVWLASSVVADISITLGLVWHLRKNKTGFVATDDLINKIIRLTVHTGMITAVCATVDLIAFLTTSSGIHLVFNIPLSKLYTNSLMSSLNSRAGWNYGTGIGKGLVGNGGRSSGDVELTTNPGVLHFDNRSSGRPVPQVYIDVETIQLEEQAGDRKYTTLNRSDPMLDEIDEHIDKAVHNC